MALRFTLLQARKHTDPVRAEERGCFARALRVDESAIRPVDILSEPLDDGLLEATDVLLVGGAGEFSVVDPVEPVARFIDFLSAAAEQGFPTFASCFGFQALVVGLGGEVIHDSDHGEVGTYTLQRSAAGRSDPLFAQLPDTFLAQLGHNDRASRLPEGATNLATSALAPFQALRWRELPVYATQFHPELTDIDNQLRFRRYMTLYGRLLGTEEAQRRLDAHQASPESNGLIRLFVDHFCAG